jgi:hypothetical protein
MGVQGRSAGTGRVIPPQGWSSNRPTACGNCRGCGAALRKPTCEYCGRTAESMFLDLSAPLPSYEYAVNCSGVIDPRWYTPFPSVAK